MMLRYYLNSNAKPRGGNLKEKVQTLVLCTFHKHLCELTYIDTTTHTNKHKHTQTHIDTYLQITIHILTHENYIIFSQDVSNCFEFFSTVELFGLATAFTKNRSGFNFL